MYKNYAFDPIYDDFPKKIAYTFAVVSKHKCDAFLVWDTLIGSFMFSDIRKRHNPKYLNYYMPQFLEALEFDLHFYWKETPYVKREYEIDGVECSDYDICWWTGYVLAYFFWRYAIDFEDWLKYFSSKDVYLMFYPGHEASWEWMASCLNDKYKEAKKLKKFRVKEK